MARRPYNAAMSPTPFNWKVPAGRALEAALNHMLALDPDTRAALRTLDGRRVALQVDAPPLALQVTVEGEALRVGPAADAPDLQVRGTLSGLIAQLPFLRRDDAPPIGKMMLSGDADLARRLQRLAERFDPDWQRPFAAAFGDVLGVQIAQGLARALRQARVLGRELAGSTAEYLTEESRDVVARGEVEAFCDDVDALRDDVERLAARIARLQRGAAA